MAGRGSTEGSLLPTHAIYPTARPTQYVILLGLSKCLKAFGVFLAYDLLKLIHLVPLLFILRLGSATCFILLQKPFSAGQRLTRSQWWRVFRHSTVSSILSLLWLYGLTLCGPLRTILLFEHYDVVVIAAVSALFSGSGGPGKLRGSIFFLLAVVGILFFDHDDYDQHPAEYHPEGHHSGFISHTFSHLFSWSGLSDHKGGVFLLLVTTAASVLFSGASKRLSVEVGGAKRLHALSTLFSAVFLSPWALYVSYTTESAVVSSVSLLLPVAAAFLTLDVLSYYGDSLASSKMDAAGSARVAAFSIFCSSLVLSIFWGHPFVAAVTSLAQYTDLITEDHLLSGGVIMSFGFLILATHALTKPTNQSRGTIVGYSANGTPLYGHGTTVAGGASLSALARSALRQVLEDSNSRSIFFFLCINLLFTFVELVYGAWSNSLGLISDGFHMFFDCSALVVGLYASVMSRWKATKTFSYGYDRMEVLSGFVNGLFLVVISFFVFLTALGRLHDPPDINTDRLLIVSILGLCVNLVGIAAFSHAHTHGGTTAHNHSHGGSHSHNGPSHGHSHDSTPNTNMQGVFLHVLADTLGSVGVIISSLLVQMFGWNIADPVCSLFIATLILASVVPLLKDTANMLVLRTPKDLQLTLSNTIQTVLDVPGVLSCSEEHFWRQSGSVVCGTVHIQVEAHICEQQITSQIVSIIKQAGVRNLCVQVEKEDYYHHMSGLSAGGGLADKTVQQQHQPLSRRSLAPAARVKPM